MPASSRGCSKPRPSKKSLRFVAILLLLAVQFAMPLLPASTGKLEFLVPSQVFRKQDSTSSDVKVQPSKNRQRPRNLPSSTLIPSRLYFSKPTDAILVDNLPSSESTRSETNQVKKEVTFTSSNQDQNASSKRRKRRNRSKTKNSFKQRWEGNLPDVTWRAVPMEHLRAHPNVVSLPPAHTIRRLESLEDVRNFRQDSWQWDVVHKGRCTTSQAVAALGFLEPETGSLLGVPRSWQRGGVGAFHRLGEEPLRTLEEMNTILCSEYTGEESAVPSDSPNSSHQIWTKPNMSSGKHSRPFPFAAKYKPMATDEERQRKQQSAKQYASSVGFGAAVRMMWGNAQEATALLTALNFFWKTEKNIVLQEVGMCGAGLDLNSTSADDDNSINSSGLLVGASPDGLLCYPDGRVEVLEVKNHCPFYLKSPSSGHKSRTKSSTNQASSGKFVIRSFDFDKVGVLPHYVPQLMMEMMCVGPNCQSAIMVRQSAMNGALILRINRDESWIKEMMYWLDRFQTDFVEAGVPPPPNFFLESGSPDDQSRYRRFLNQTKELESRVELLEHVPHPEIQRVRGVTPGNTNLFLD